MKVTRRAFIAASLTTALGLTGCGNSSSPVTEDITDKIPFTSYTFNGVYFELPEDWKELSMDSTDTDGFISNEDDGGKFFFCIQDTGKEYSAQKSEKWLKLYAETVADAYWPDHELSDEPNIMLDSDYGVIIYDSDVYQNDEITEKGKLFVIMQTNWIIHGYIMFSAESYESDQKAIAEEVAMDVGFDGDYDFESNAE